ncbi:MAG: hypothetical protein J6A04_04795 [Clostridia bacterium]|nr:hypothetical protein [Clostridia bacterium]
MGWREFFGIGKKKPIMIDAPKVVNEPKVQENVNYSQTIQNDSIEPNKSTEVQVFSIKNGNDEIQYHYRMQWDGQVVNVATVQGGKDVSLKQIKRKLEDAVNHVTTAKNPITLERKKQETIEHLQKICEKSSGLTLDESVVDVISQYQPKDMLNYDNIEGLKKTIDLNAITPEEANRLRNSVTRTLETSRQD